jgi:predicted TIM-barrel fold metal-dependent hydrolase
MEDTNLFNEFRGELEKIPLVDTHEHFILEEDRLGLSLDLFYLIPHYASSDLLSSGMPPSVLDDLRGVGSHQLSLEQKWSAFEPYWLRIKNTGYARALELIARDIFGVDGISEETYQSLSEKISLSNKKGWYTHVLKEKANIEFCILEYLGGDMIYCPAPALGTELAYLDRKLGRTVPPLGLDMVRRVENLDGLIGIRNLEGVRKAEKAYDLPIHTLDDLLKAVDRAIESGTDQGIVGIKTALAYHRIIHYERTTRHEAETLFNRIFDHLGEGISWKEAKPLQDFAMHHVIRRAIDSGLPIQVHTGLQEGVGNIITNARPTHLVNLFVQYPQARFDIFHSAFPYTGELTTLAKNFPNVYANLCWMYVISPYAARRTLAEWIETIPSNKIFGFGGDYIIVEGSYAHAKMARDNIARVLVEKIEEGTFSLSEAQAFARRIMRENALEFYGIGAD